MGKGEGEEREGKGKEKWRECREEEGGWNRGCCNSRGTRTCYIAHSTELEMTCII